MNKIKESHVKDKAVLFVWITGLLLFISMLWIFTQSIQSFYLMRTVNNILISNNDTRRLSASIQQKSDKANMLGYWYSINNSTDKMFVFAVFQDGILVPLGAIVSADGRVNEIIPLSGHAVQIFSTLPESLLQMYKTRIEASFQMSSLQMSYVKMGSINVSFDIRLTEGNRL